MLRFLTLKLRTQSLNEEEQIEKNQEDYDSGTESDDESGEANNNTKRMELEGGDRDVNESHVHLNEGIEDGRESAGSQLDSYYGADSAVGSEVDGGSWEEHSSEEELEVINSSYVSESLPESNKRKWCEVSRLSVDSLSSSDEEVQGLLLPPLSTPVEFCTSPPLDAHKPSRATVHESSGSSSPPPKLFLLSPPAFPSGCENEGGRVAVSSTSLFRGLRPCDLYNTHPHSHPNSQNNSSGALPPHSPSHSYLVPSSGGERGEGGERGVRRRKRHRGRQRVLQRPWLDFEKMQQLKARSVTTWRSGGELSLYCS